MFTIFVLSEPCQLLRHRRSVIDVPKRQQKSRRRRWQCASLYNDACRQQLDGHQHRDVRHRLAAHRVAVALRHRIKVGKL